MMYWASVWGVILDQGETWLLVSVPTERLAEMRDDCVRYGMLFEPWQ